MSVGENASESCGGDSWLPDERGADGVFLRTGRIHGGSVLLFCGKSTATAGGSKGICVTLRSRFFFFEESRER